ncbi:MAG: hypothetical protein EA349_09580 [Halomonadaceae bacterium]|nr:MAG: hypothetical protein EA349_09580 [Halomonadaceae bacterium]
MSRWQSAIAGASNSNTLDQVYREMEQAGIPGSFEPVTRLRRTLADAYVKQAEQLLANNQARQAQPLLQKATTLMRYGNTDG